MVVEELLGRHVLEEEAGIEELLARGKSAKQASDQHCS
jgi:hypothetical protein